MNESDYYDLKNNWEQYKEIDHLVSRPDIQKSAPVLCRAYADYKHAKATIEIAIHALDVTY